VRPDEAAEAAEVVEQLDVGLGAEERLVLVLPVEVYRVGGHLAEDVERGGGVVDEGAAARGRDLAADDEDALRARLDLVGAQERRQPPLVGVVEDPLDDGLPGAGADGLRARAVTEEQPEGADEDALPRARLARDDVEPAVELDLELLDEGVVADAEASKHCGLRIADFGSGQTTQSIRTPQSEIRNRHARPWQCLYFFPEPQGHGSFLPTRSPTTTGSAFAVGSRSAEEPWLPLPPILTA